MKNGSMNYFCEWVIGATGTIDRGLAQTVLSVLGVISMGVATLFVVPLANKFSKRTVCMAGMLAHVIDHIEFKSGIRTDGLTMSIYSSLMVAATPIMNAVLKKPPEEQAAIAARHKQED